MRRFLLIIFVIPLAAHAQFNKGDKYVGAAISGFNGSAFGASPFVGYFINPRMSLGAYVQANTTKSEYISNFNDGPHQMIQKNRDLVAAITVRRWYMLSDKFYFALQGEGFYSRDVNTQRDNTQNSDFRNKRYGVGLNVVPAFIYFPLSRLGVEASIAALSYQFSYGLSDGARNHNVNFGWGNVNLGLAYYFESK